MIGFASLLLSIAVLPDDSQTPEPVTGTLSTGDRWGWTYGFDATLEAQSITIRVGINTVPIDGVTLAQLMRAEADWEERAEQVWNCAAALQLSSGETYPIRTDIVFRQSPLHHTVLVKPLVGVPHQLSWSIKTEDWLVAHEIGHMIGAYDDYQGGAQDANAPVEDDGSIMTDWPTSGEARLRHFDRIAAWFRKRTGDEVTVVPAADGCT